MRATKKHVDEIVKLVTKLRDLSVPEEEKIRAENRLKEIRDEVTAHEYGVTKDRIPDIQYLERVIADPKSTEFDRERARLGIIKIKNESTLVKSMRKSLIREVRSGNPENVKDITEYVSKRKRYQ